MTDETDETDETDKTDKTDETEMNATGEETGTDALPDESEGGEGVGLTMGDEPNTFEPEEDPEAAAGDD